MAAWLATIPTSDNLCTINSGVFQKYVHVAGHAFSLCQLCSRKNLPSEQLAEPHYAVRKLEAHVNDPLHQQRAAELLKKRDAMSSRLCWSLQHLEAADYFGCPTLESQMFRHIVAGSSASQATVEQQLKELRLSDPLVHLELALWKAACKVNPPAEEFARVLEWMSWNHSGWKAHKSKMRRHPLTGITALVAPFLGLKKKMVVLDGASSARVS
jgi:hypothetical protein